LSFLKVAALCRRSAGFFSLLAIGAFFISLAIWKYRKTAFFIKKTMLE